MTELVLRQAGSLWRQLQGLDRVWVLVCLIPLVLVLADPDRAGAVLTTAANAFAGTVPYMAIAIAMIAYLRASGAEGVVLGYAARRRPRQQHGELAVGLRQRSGRGALFPDFQPNLSGREIRPGRRLCASLVPGTGAVAERVPA